MRKIFAILLLALMVFNLAGYRMLFGYLEQQAQVKMAQNLDKNIYNKACLIEVKIALHLPYPTNSDGFERYDGTAELNGVTYSYVERAVENDTLILRCLPNKASDNIKLADNEYGKAVNDIQPTQKNQKGNAASLLLKSLLLTVYGTHGNFGFKEMFFAAQLAAYKTASEKIADGMFAKSPEQPPELA